MSSYSYHLMENKSQMGKSNSKYLIIALTSNYKN
jgi:hypothetical protein